MGLAYSLRECGEFTSIMVGSVAAGRQGTGAAAESFHVETTTMKKCREREREWGGMEGERACTISRNSMGF